MLSLLLLCLAMLAGPSWAEGAEGMEHLALRGAAGATEMNFNEFRSPATIKTSAATADAHGYFAWKNHCVRVARMAAGGSFEFGGESGFATVAPYVLLPEPTTAGFMEQLLEELTL